MDFLDLQFGRLVDTSDGAFLFSFVYVMYLSIVS